MPKLSIIIPVFNEENFIEEVLEKVYLAPIFDWEKEIIVVDDGSTDNSKFKISAFAKDTTDRPRTTTSCIWGRPRTRVSTVRGRQNLKIISHEKNQGKGAAIRTALKEVTGDYVLIQDADLEYSPEDYQKLLKPIKEKGVPVVYGSRNIKPLKRGYFLNFWGGKFLTFLTNLFFGSSLTDISTCYKLFETEILKKLNLKSSRFEFCEEVTVKSLKAGYKIVEVPISYFPRKIKEGKKLRFKDGIIGFWTIVKLKFLK